MAKACPAVIASQRIGAKHHPMTGSAMQSISGTKKERTMITHETGLETRADRMSHFFCDAAK
jgi:hypothetical protein